MISTNLPIVIQAADAPPCVFLSLFTAGGKEMGESVKSSGSGQVVRVFAPSAAIDPSTGRLKPLTDEERAARLEALSRAFDEIDGMTDGTDTDEVWRDVLRGIDESRPHRPLFEGAY
jgi:hypothetical protein